MKHRSVRFKFTIVMAMVVITVVMAICVFNTIFFEKFYIKDVQKKLIKDYNEVSVLYSSKDRTSEELKQTIKTINEIHGINIFILNDKWEIAYSSQNINYGVEWFQEILFNQSSIVETLAENNKYTLVKGFDNSIKRNYLEIFGTVNEGDQIFMQVTLEGIKANVTLFNRFIIIVGLVILVIGIIVVYFIADRFVRPINKLSKLANHMSEMKFDEKYDGKDDDEIGMLGQSMNIMAENLERNIYELSCANEQLVKDIEIRKNFLSNVSHELKTPISLIQGYAEGIKEGVADDEASRDYYCDVIIDESVKMNRLVRNLMEIERFEQGAGAEEKQIFDIYDVISDIISTNEIYIAKKNINVMCDIPKETRAYFDPNLFETVFANYFSNAINHCIEEGEIRISCTSEQRLKVYVSNMGTQIPDKDIEHIWEKFYKVDKARTREYGGNGIGLSIVKAIMDNYQLDYGVFNNQDGVSFWFEVEKANI